MGEKTLDSLIVVGIKKIWRGAAGVSALRMGDKYLISIDTKRGTHVWSEASDRILKSFGLT